MELPLPKEALPDKVQRFGAPDAPTGAKTMAAKGLVPVKGDDLVTLLVQLAHDSDATVREAAKDTLAGLPEGVLRAACQAELHGAILAGLVATVRDRQPLLEELVANRALPPAKLAEVAKWAS